MSFGVAQLDLEHGVPSARDQPLQVQARLRFGTPSPAASARSVQPWVPRVLRLLGCERPVTPGLRGILLTFGFI